MNPSNNAEEDSLMNHESPVYKDTQKSNNFVTYSTVAVHRGNFPH
jgi:hypothetical protein